MQVSWIKGLSVLFILLALAFASGRYSVKSPAITKTTQTETNTEREKHKETETVTEKRPDGSETTRTRIIEDTNTRRKNETDTTVKIEPPKPMLNVSALGAYKDGELAYGLSVTKQFVGPVTAGIFGLNNGTIGLSIGVNF